MIIRKKYISPYRRARYISIDLDSMKSKKDLIDKIEDRSKHWRDATYFLKDDSSVFARFKTEDGKVVKLFKVSPVTDQTYKCWECFRKK